MCGARKQKMDAVLSGMTSLNAIQFCFMIDDNDQTCQLFDEIEFQVHSKKKETTRNMQSHRNTLSSVHSNLFDVKIIETNVVRK